MFFRGGALSSILYNPALFFFLEIQLDFHAKRVFKKTRNTVFSYYDINLLKIGVVV